MSSVSPLDVKCFTILNENIEVGICTFGATVTSLKTRDKEGQMGDVLLGFNSVEGWMSDACPSMNCCVGRTAGRNGPILVVDGQEWKLPGCDGGGGGIDPTTNLHGGFVWQKANWEVIETTATTVTLRNSEPEGPFPGDLSATVKFSVLNNDFAMEYSAETTAATPVSFTNHCYWDLSAGKDKNTFAHTLYIDADSISPDDGSGNGLPTGEHRPLGGSQQDLTSARTMEDIIASQAEANPLFPHGEEYNLTQNVGKDWNRLGARELPHVATLSHPPSGRVMEIRTSEPCIQTYYATLLDDMGAEKCKDGRCYGKYGAVCLEAQRHANAEAGKDIPSRILRPGEIYHQLTIHRFPDPR